MGRAAAGSSLNNYGLLPRGMRMSSDMALREMKGLSVYSDGVRSPMPRNKQTHLQVAKAADMRRRSEAESGNRRSERKQAEESVWWRGVCLFGGFVCQLWECIIGISSLVSRSSPLEQLDIVFLPSFRP